MGVGKRTDPRFVLLASVGVLLGGPALALQPMDPVRIDEVNYDPPESPEEPFEFVELYNAGCDPVYLDGAVISDEGNSGVAEASFKFPGTPGGTQIPLAAHGYLLLVGDATGSSYPGIGWEFYAGGADSDNPAVPNLVKTAGSASDLQLGNTGDGLTLSVGITTGLVIPCSEIVDGVSWENGGAPDITALSRTMCSDPQPHPGITNTMESMQRCPGATDSDQGSALDFGIGLRTPGVANVVTTPPPNCSPLGGVPADFHLLAGSGGITPWESIYRVEIDAQGCGEFRSADPTARAADSWTTTARFQVSPAGMADLWNTIQANGFFGLPSPICEPLKHDGWYADMIIQGGGNTKRVTCQNISPQTFDNIGRKINEETPPGQGLIYGTVHP